jgi:hypothetical protein
MKTLLDPQVTAQAEEVLNFMAKNVQGRPMLHGLLMSDVYRWASIPDAEKPTVFARDVRRFAVACPHLVTKDRIRHSLEALGILEAIVFRSHPAPSDFEYAKR